MAIYSCFVYYDINRVYSNFFSGSRNNGDGNNRLSVSENGENNAPILGVRVDQNGDCHLAANPHQST